MTHTTIYDSIVYESWVPETFTFDLNRLLSVKYNSESQILWNGKYNLIFEDEKTNVLTEKHFLIETSGRFSLTCGHMHKLVLARMYAYI